MSLIGKTLIGRYSNSGVVISQENDLFKVSLDNGLVKDFTYEKLLELFDIDDENKVIGNKYIGMRFTSKKDGSICKVIKQVTFDKKPSQCFYLVEFEDGTQGKVIYNSLKSGAFKKPKKYIGATFISNEDNSKCIIIKQVTFDKSPSLCRYLVEFEDKTQKEFSYCILRKGNFTKPKSYINKIFTSKDGYKCKIIKQLTFDKIPSACYYLVEFEDGTQCEFNYETLHFREFRKPKIYIGNIFTSIDGIKCKVIKQITFDKPPSSCDYLVEFLDDGTQAKFNYKTLKNNNFKKPVPYIDREFIGLDGSKCKIIKQLTFDKKRTLCYFLVEFEDGTQGKFIYNTLRSGTFKKRKDYTGEISISMEGLECKIIKQITFDKIHSLCKYRVRFKNGYEKDLTYKIFKGKKFSAIPSEFKHCNSNSVIDNKYYKCTCKLCNYNDFLTIDEMVEHLQDKHNLYNN